MAINSYYINKEELQHYKTYAGSTLRKNELVGIDLSPEDFEKIQQQAVEMGISYEALIANIVHQFVAGRLVEQS
jgi:predicted DNA binding CopG/RHH family protein